MTAGSNVHSPSNSYDETYVKTWSGANGKYLSDGRDKWNAYSMHLVMESVQYGQNSFPVHVNSGPSLMTWNNADEMRLQSKLVKKTRGHEFNLAVNLAQANQLIEMCSTTILKLGRSLWYLKRGDIQSAARELGIGRYHQIRLNSRDVSGRWLELQYGWLPSVSDAFEAAKAFEALSEGRAARIVAVHKKYARIDRSAAPSIYSAPGYQLLVKKIVYEMDEELSFARSLGLLDPASVVWEIVPYSFVIDWFLPIGTYLDNLSVIPKLKGRFLSSLYSKWDTRFFGVNDPNYKTLLSGTRRFGHGRDLTRSISSSLTTQGPSFVNPITALSRRRIASAVALVHQALT